MKQLFIITLSVVIGFWIGSKRAYENAYQAGYSNAYFQVWTEVHRQCKSGIPLLGVDEFFKCTPMESFLNE